jgi:hypothetical protein
MNKLKTIINKKFESNNLNKNKINFSKLIFEKYKENIKIFIQNPNIKLKNETENICKICNKKIDEKKITNFLSYNKTLNENNSNYIICEKCLIKNIKYISSNISEKFILQTSNNLTESTIKLINNENFEVEWGDIQINGKNVDNEKFLFGLMKSHIKFTVKFKIHTPSPPPKHFKLEKQGGIGSILIENEKEENEFTKEFIIYDLDKLYPGKYKKYIFLKEGRNNSSNRKY